MQKAAGTCELRRLYQRWFEGLSNQLQPRGPVLVCLNVAGDRAKLAKGGQSLRDVVRRPYAFHDDIELVLDITKLC